MLDDQEVKNVKSNIRFEIEHAISELYDGFRDLEDCPLKSFNNKKRELRDNIISNLKDLNERIQEQI